MISIPTQDSEPAIAFGTSGLRGRAEGFTKAAVFAHVAAFLDTACGASAARRVVIGRDLRQSSPQIAGLVGGAVRALGWEPVNGGTVPTPALAAYALARNLPAIMVTGSHIPADYNGLKFYRPEGELLKADEAPIRDKVARGEGGIPEFAPELGPEEPGVARDYVRRYLDAVGADTLAGLRIGVFEHSAVGRDLLAEILAGLGAECVALGRSDMFVAVDTEAVEPHTLAMLRAAVAREGFDAVVSADGDGDRPLLIDATGRQINGDVLGALTARWLGAETVLTPLTSTSAVEASGWFTNVIRTRIGSPYVVEAMAAVDGAGVVGFEANGGFLTGSVFALGPGTLGSGTLSPLPTRDAVLPLIGVLAEARARGVSVADLAAQLPRRVMAADRLKQIAPDRGQAFVEAMARSAQMRGDIDAVLNRPVAIDTTDGTRLVLGEGRIVHFRQSGNAPELRCYVETASAAQTEALLARLMARLAAHFQTE